MEIPAKYERLLSPEALAKTVATLDSLTCDILDIEDVGREIGALLKRKNELETQIKIEESDAIMHSQEFSGLKNDAQRNAFRRSHTSGLRTELARVMGDIASLNIDIEREYKDRDSLVAAATAEGRKAALQEALLNFLTGGKQ